MATHPLARTTLLVGFILAGCAGLEPEGSGTRGAFGRAGATSPAGLRLVTYNVGLAHGAVALADERLPLLPAQLRSTNADVLCLNEVWTDEDYASIRDGLAQDYPYAFRERTTDSSWPKLKCLPWTVWKLNSCVQSSCTPNGISAEECVRGPCKARYDVLSDGCKICLSANTASPLDCVIWGAKDFAFGGRNGLALFSRLPMEDARYDAFDTVMIKRGVITATIAGTRVQCTHMTSDLVVVPYPKGGSFESWQEEQAAQLDLLTPADEQCTVLMGDLNAGPAVAEIKGEVPSSYEALLQNGFEEPWAEPRCTFCKENPLAGAPNDLWLDHIMFRSCPGLDEPLYQRMMESPVNIKSDGTMLKTRYSDHYGLAVDL